MFQKSGLMTDLNSLHIGYKENQNNSWITMQIFGKKLPQSQHKLIFFKTQTNYFKTLKAHIIYILLKKILVSAHFLFKYHLKLKKKRKNNRFIIKKSKFLKIFMKNVKFFSQNGC